MLDRKVGVNDETLTKVFQGSLFGVAPWALAVHDVVKSFRSLEQIIYAAKDTEDTKGEDPDTDDSDNRGLTADKPAEETEEGSYKVHHQNSTG